MFPSVLDICSEWARERIVQYTLRLLHFSVTTCFAGVHVRDQTPPLLYRLVGLGVKASASRTEDPGFESRLRRDFFGVESYQ